MCVPTPKLAVLKLAVVTPPEVLTSWRDEHGIPLGEGGLHAGEWETSMLMSVHPELVHLERGEPGYTGSMEDALGAIFESGVHALAPNGVIGDPTRASAEHGARYWDTIMAVTIDAISQP